MCNGYLVLLAVIFILPFKMFYISALIWCDLSSWRSIIIVTFVRCTYLSISEFYVFIWILLCRLNQVINLVIKLSTNFAIGFVAIFPLCNSLSNVVAGIQENIKRWMFWEILWMSKILRLLIRQRMSVQILQWEIQMSLVGLELQVWLIQPRSGSPLVMRIIPPTILSKDFIMFRIPQMWADELTNLVMRLPVDTILHLKFVPLSPMYNRNGTGMVTLFQVLLPLLEELLLNILSKVSPFISTIIR